MAFFPAGSSSLRRVPVAVRKLAACRHALPAPLALAFRIRIKPVTRIMSARGSLQPG